METKKKNLKTTIAGIAGIIGLILVAIGAIFDTDPNTVADWAGVIQGIGASGMLGGFGGLIAAKDAKDGTE